jgi:eukaryotic-like serine/threonine-protein kinase
VSRAGWKLTIADRAGRSQQILPGLFPWSPRISRDGSKLAYAASPPGKESGDVWSSDVWPTDVWIADLRSGTTQRLTTDGNDNNEPQWSPDGRSVAFDAGLLGGKDVYVKELSGADSARLLTQLPGDQFPTDWAADGGAILFQNDSGGGADIWIQRLDGSAPRPFIVGPGSQDAARVSPDAHWVAYVSTETGSDEVYVQSYPSLGRKALVSEGGGAGPAWRHDGRELYYWKGDELIAVGLDPGGAGSPPVIRSRTSLFRAARVDAAGYDVSPDGSRFVFVAGGPRANRLVVALNLLPSGKSAERAADATKRAPSLREGSERR